MQTEKNVSPPCIIIFQPEHSVLAGAIARALVPDLFGELPAEVLAAIAQHDYGWSSSDTAQMQSLAQRLPRPFPALSNEEIMPSWRASIQHARSQSRLAYVIVSRHFTTLATGDESKAAFVEEETERRASVEQDLGCATSDLNRWTGAIGFCDLVSLYLCCGSEEAAEFPLAHPADPDSANARRTILSKEDGSLYFSPPTLKGAVPLSLECRSYAGDTADTAPYRLEWRFPNG